jgi:hypothetical protein
MSIKKIVFRNFTKDGVVNKIIRVRFHILPDVIFSTGTTITDNSTIYETNTIRIDAAAGWSSGSIPSHAFNSGIVGTADGWVGQASANVTVTFKTPLSSLYKITFSNWTPSSQYVGGTVSFIADFYDESNVIIKSYDVANLELDTTVKTLLTLEFIGQYSTEVQLVTTPPVNTLGRYRLDNIVVTDSNELLVMNTLADAGSSMALGAGTLKYYNVPTNSIRVR